MHDEHTQSRYRELALVGALGPVCLFLGLVVWRVRRGTLIAARDPRLAEGASHRNYV